MTKFASTTFTPSQETYPAVRQRPVHADRAAQSIRILYAAGSGDILGTYGHWKDQRDDPSQLSLTYSGQFFDLCRRLQCEGQVLVHDRRIGRMRDGRITVRQRGVKRFQNGPAILYHLAQLLAALRIILLALRVRTKVVVPASGACHWFPLIVLPWFGVRVVPALHCVLWPKYRRPGRVARLINALDAVFFTRGASVILTASRDIDEQLAEMAGPQRVRRLKLVPFLPTYRPAQFPPGSAAPPAPPFRVLYAGRIVPEKGVFDLLTVAGLLHRQGRTDIEFDVCGDGSALAEMRRRAEAAGFAQRMRFHGHCQRTTMVEMFRQCHVVLVPTTSGFVEGFNQVVAEGILAGRPVITSAVCPAVRYAGEAVVAVPPDSVEDYAGAIVRLAGDPGAYERCAAACQTVRQQFFDEHRGWGAALETALRMALPQALDHA